MNKNIPCTLVMYLLVIIALLLILLMTISTLLFLISLDLIIKNFDFFTIYPCLEHLEQKEFFVLSDTITNKSINSKLCIFDPFINLFKVENSSYRYFPSFFINNNDLFTS